MFVYQQSCQQPLSVAHTSGSGYARRMPCTVATVSAPAGPACLLDRGRATTVARRRGVLPPPVCACASQSQPERTPVPKVARRNLHVMMLGGGSTTKQAQQKAHTPEGSLSVSPLHWWTNEGTCICGCRTQANGASGGPRKSSLQSGSARIHSRHACSEGWAGGWGTQPPAGALGIRGPEEQQVNAAGCAAFQKA